MDNKEASEPTSLSGLQRLWSELRRRKVIRVSTAYIVTGWIIIQIASSTFADFGIPVWAFRFVVMMVLLGLPLSVILAWAFELTPDGIRTTRKVQDEQLEEYKPEHHRRRNWTAYAVGALLPTLIFGALSLYFYLQSSPEPDIQEIGIQALMEELQKEEEKSIAVLPLSNLSPDPDNAFFAAGVHEDILTNLSKVQALQVKSRTSMIGYQDTTKNLIEIGKELGVRYLVEGSVRRAGDRVRVTVQLIDAQTDEHLWAENYDRTLDDIFAIQGDIAKEIAAQLKAAIAPAEAARIDRKRTDNPEAYDYFLKYRQIQDESGGKKGDEKIALLEKAIELDPEYAEAWAELSVECVFWWATGKDRNDPELLKKGHQALKVAERLAPDQPFVPRAKASFARWEDQSAAGWQRNLEDALALDPTYDFALSRLGDIAYDNADFARAANQAKSLLELEPDDERAYGILRRSLREQEKWEEARMLIQTNMEKDPDNKWWGSADLAELDYHKNKDKAAFINELKRIEPHLPDHWTKIYLLMVLREFDRALELIDTIPSDLGLFTDLWYESSHLEAAMIWYLIGNKPKWIDEAKKAEKFLIEELDKDHHNIARISNDLALTYAFLGDRTKADNMIKEMGKSFPTLHSRVQYEKYLAEIYLILEERDLAINHLTRAIIIGEPFKTGLYVDLEPFWDPLRDDPRLQAVLAN